MNEELKAGLARAEKFAKDHVQELASEMMEWQDTGLLRVGRMHELAEICRIFDKHGGLAQAESMAKRAAVAHAARHVGDAVAWEVGLDVYRTHTEAAQNVRNPDLKLQPLYRATPSARTLSEQEVADHLIASSLLTDLGHRALINGDTMDASLEFLACFANSLAATSAPVEAPSKSVKRWEDRIPLCPTSDEISACMRAEISEYRALQGKLEAPKGGSCG